MKELKNNGRNKHKQQTDAGETPFSSNKKRDPVWMSKQYYTKLQQKINEGDILPRQDINKRFLSDEKKNQQRQMMTLPNACKVAKPHGHESG